MSKKNLKNIIGGVDTSRAPFVFWDGFGLSGTHSGILTHAVELHKELGVLGVDPMIVGETGLEYNFPRAEIRTIRRIFQSCGLTRIKLIWPYFVESLIDSLSYEKFHIVHGLSNFNVPLTRPKKCQKRILTVHDVIPLLDPKMVSTGYALQFKLAISRALDVVDQIICVSNWTLESLVSFFPHAVDRCTVIYNGVRKERKNTAPKSHDKSIEILSIGRFERYKRIDFLIEIIRRLPRSYSLNLVTDHKGLLFCNRNAQDLISTEQLKLYTALSKDQLDMLYGKSHIYLHPSLYEGFNIPAVEAAVNGLPVIFTKGLGTEEIIGSDLGISVDKNYGIDSWVDSVSFCAKHLENRDWKLNANMALKTLPTWQQNAALTLKIYQKIT